jgi:hypothetical protein
MTNEQRSEFEQRRLNVVRQHVANDPKIRALRRKRKWKVVTSVLGSVVAVAVAMVLIKSFVLAVHGPRDFAQIMAPVLDGTTAGSVPSLLFGPDPVSSELAAILQPLLPGSTRLAVTAPEAPMTPDIAGASVAEPET